MERTKFFAVKLPPEDNSVDGLRLEDIHRTVGDMYSSAQTTPLRDTRVQTVQDIKGIIVEGDRYLVVQTVCLLEGDEPRPPIRVTEYK